jgi:AcrR family transcriptional regulator
MDHSSRGEVFDRLRQAMKARKMTYRALGERLGLSEPSVKRLFQDKDCKLGRLVEICAILDIPLGALLDADPMTPPRPTALAPDVEAALADNVALFHLLLLLMDGFSPGDLQSLLGLTEGDLFLYFRDLERLGLVALERKESAPRLLIPLPISWSPDGRLLEEVKTINARYLRWVMDGLGANDHAFHTMSRHMHPDSAEKTRADIAELAKTIARRARRDQLLYAPEDLVGVKWLCAFAPAPFQALLSVPPHPKGSAVVA